MPNHLTLFPPPTAGQIEGIATTALTAAGAAALRSLVGALRTNVLSVAQRTKFDPVLTSIGLLKQLDGAGVPAVPFGLFGDPVGYLAHEIGWSANTGPAADAVATLLDGVRNVFGLPGAAHGVLPITSSFTIGATAATTGGLRLALGYSGTETDLTSTIDAGLTLAPGSAPLPHLDLSLGISGHTAHIDLALDGPALSVILHTSGGDIALLPMGPGLGSLATTAVQQALPFVLDALHDHAPNPIPTVLTAVRDVLGLGTASFDATELQTLAANPGAELVRRLVAHGTAVFTDLQAVLPSGLPAPWAVTADSSHLRVTYGAQWIELRLSGAPQKLTVEASITADLPGITGASMTVDAIVDTTGLRSLTASGQIAPANALTIGPLSLAPIVEIAAGPDASPPRVEAGLVVNDGVGTRSALLSIDLSPIAVTLRTRTNSTDDPTPDPAVVVTHVLVPLVADAALHETHVHDLLATTVGGTTLGGLLHGVLLTGGDAFDTGVLALDPADLMTRLVTLIANIANATPPLALPDNLQLTFTDGGTKRGIAITVAAGQRADLIPGGDIGLAFEVDNSWVDPVLNPPGLSVMIVETAGQPRFIPPLITVDGVGLRLYRRSGALLDTGISIGSIGLFGLLRIDAAGPGVTDGGLALQLADIAIAPAAASGGSNGVAQGILGNTKQSGGGGDGTALKPKFSPELALQKRQGAPDFAWSLTAGPGNGPWMLHIGRSFGPLRIDDVGFGDEVTNHKVTSIRIFISGGLSLAGLNIDVQELSIGAPWPDGSSGHALTDPSAWSLDLAGLAVSYSGGGVQLAGGLRRRDNPSLPGNPPDYVGVLLARIGPYGLTAFGGYGQFPSPDGKFTALFIFAAINAPIGGPPAFFVTGLGGGAGINRALVLPTELNDFASFPMIAALDPHSTLADDPEHAMDLLSSSFPPQHGTFWFAAGVSFTSFALVDVVAVVAIEVGDGFAITLLGLARAALPTTYLPLVQLELALMAHFSTSEGILEVRAQLTDNSFLLTRDCRLTGGFAYVSWFGPNPNAGQFVLTIGGYHPSFHRDGYPDVPRVGFRWDVFGCLTITGESYFAITSEALMVGTRFTAALSLGPLWASLTLGVDAIVFFDPFHFLATGYAVDRGGHHDRHRPLLRAHHRDVVVPPRCERHRRRPGLPRQRDHRPRRHVGDDRLRWLDRREHATTRLGRLRTEVPHRKRWQAGVVGHRSRRRHHAGRWQPDARRIRRKSLAARAGILLRNEHGGRERRRSCHRPHRPGSGRRRRLGDRGVRRRRDARHRADAARRDPVAARRLDRLSGRRRDAGPVLRRCAERRHLARDGDCSDAQGCVGSTVAVGRDPDRRHDQRGQRAHPDDPGRHLGRVTADRLRAGATGCSAAAAVRGRGHRAAGPRLRRVQCGRLRRGCRHRRDDRAEHRAPISRQRSARDTAHTACQRDVSARPGGAAQARAVDRRHRARGRRATRARRRPARYDDTDRHDDRVARRRGIPGRGHDRPAAVAYSDDGRAGPRTSWRPSGCNARAGADVGLGGRRARSRTRREPAPHTPASAIEHHARRVGCARDLDRPRPVGWSSRRGRRWTGDAQGSRTGRGPPAARRRRRCRRVAQGARVGTHHQRDAATAWRSPRHHRAQPTNAISIRRPGGRSSRSPAMRRCASSRCPRWAKCSPITPRTRRTSWCRRTPPGWWRGVLAEPGSIPPDSPAGPRPTGCRTSVRA